MDIRRFVNVEGAVPEPPLEQQTLAERYAPRRSTDVIVNEVTLLCVKTWVRYFQAQKHGTRHVLLLSGPSGTGKSCLGRLVLREAGF